MIPDWAILGTDSVTRFYIVHTSIVRTLIFVRRDLVLPSKYSEREIFCHNFLKKGALHSIN